MLLKRLYDYSFRLEKQTLEAAEANEDGPDFSPTLYTREPVRWLIELKEDGAFVGFTDLQGGSKGQERGKVMDVPALAKMRGIALSSKLLADNGQYVLGLVAEGKDPGRVAESHRLFKALVEACAQATGEPAVQAVARFLAAHVPVALESHLDFTRLDAGDNMTFRIGRTIPIELPAVRVWWVDHLSAEAESREGVCLVTGKAGRVVERLPQPIKRIPGGQVTGLPMISANAEAFESYGLEASYNAPVSLDAAERFGKTLNYLLATEGHRLTIGPLAYVFWTRKDSGFDGLSFLKNPQPEQVEELLKSAWKGQERHLSEEDEAEFYAAALSASGSRVVVRDWLETTVRQAKASLARWFKCQELCDPFGDAGRPTGVYQLAASLYRDANKELVANVPRSLLRVALHGGALPDYIAAQAVRRNVAEQGVTQPRARLLKLWLSSQLSFTELHDKENYMTELDLHLTDEAYLCGRLLAVLESAQRLALGSPNATIVDRFYGSASTAPATVFGTLLKGSQAHLSKLRKTRPGVYAALTERLEQIMSPLGDGFPRTLALKQQALFSLGYYHQRAHDRAQAKARKELRDLDPEVNVTDSTEKENYP